jgi:deazaflavin-dependent oxidoreductase (nitroreductase family)
VVASAAGAARHPGWYHNIAAHPDQVWIEFGGRRLRVTPTQLDGDERAQAWQRITQTQPRYAGYEQKTDRAIPVIRLSPAA